MALSAHVQSLLATLGLKRRAKRVQRLDEYVAEHDGS